MNAHQRAETVRNCRAMAGMDDTSPAGHKDCGQKRLAVDEAAVQSMVATIESWENPFDSSGGDLVSLA